MSKEIKHNTTELTDEEAEKASGGTVCLPDTPAKLCLNCFKKYDHDLTVCPYCGSVKSKEILV